jgi:hypothetical protein
MERKSINFYELSGKLNVDVNLLYQKYTELFPNVKIFDFNVGLNNREIEKLKKEFK